MTATHNAIYMLPLPKFFSKFWGIAGPVAHAYGIISAFTQAGYSLDIIAEESHPTIQMNGTRLHIYPLGAQSLWKRQAWGWHLINRVKHIIEEQEPQLCYIRYSFGFTPWLPVLKKRLGRIPLVLEVNSFATEIYRWLRWFDMWAMRSADIIIPISEGRRIAIMEKVHPGLNSRILVLPNGVDIERFEKARPYFPSRKENQEIRLGYTGSIKLNYGLDILLDAFSQVRNHYKELTLHIFGEGPYRQELETASATMEGITVHGPLPFLEMPGVLKGLDILVHTAATKGHERTHHFSASPIKLYEYMAAKKSIIAAATPQVKKLLGQEEGGLLYPIGDADTLARKIVQLLDNPNLAQTLANKAFQEVKEKHSWQCRVECLLTELERRGLIDK